MMYFLALISIALASGVAVKGLHPSLQGVLGLLIAG